MPGGGLRIRRPRVPEEIRGAFARVSLTAAAVWAVAAGLFLAVMPTYAGQLVLHSQNLALLALVAALVLVSSVAAQDELTRIAPGQQRAEVSAAFYVCIYLGVSVPVIGIGLVAVATTLFTAVTTFAAVTGAGALILAAWHLRNRGRTVRDPAPGQAAPGRTGQPARTSR